MIQWVQNHSCFSSRLRQVWGDSPSFGKINGQVSRLPESVHNVKGRKKKKTERVKFVCRFPDSSCWLWIGHLDKPQKRWQDVRGEEKGCSCLHDAEFKFF